MPSVSESARFLQERLARIAPETREKELVAIYLSLRTVESDCDKAQGTLRTIASAWMLGLVGGIGLLVQNEFAAANPTVGPDTFAALRQCLILMATLGLISLWYVDQRVYQRLLHGAFAAGCWLEAHYPTIIPPIRMYIYKRNLEITTHLGWFYRGPIIVVTVVAIFNFLYALAGGHANLLAFAACMMQCAAVVLVRREEKTWPNLKDELPLELTSTDAITPTSPSASPPAA